MTRPGTVPDLRGGPGRARSPRTARPAGRTPAAATQQVHTHVHS